MVCMPTRHVHFKMHMNQISVGFQNTNEIYDASVRKPVDRGSVLDPLNGNIHKGRC